MFSFEVKPFCLFGKYWSGAKKFTRKYGSFARLSVLKVYFKTYYHLNILHVGVFQIDVKGNSRKVSDVVVVI